MQDQTVVCAADCEGSDICGYSILAVDLLHRGLYAEPGTEVINRGYFDSWPVIEDIVMA
jgi:hypothetical protein